MTIRALIVCLVALLFAPSLVFAKDGRHGAVSLDGEWDFRKIAGVFTNEQALADATGEWRSIKTPANWYKEGVDHNGVAIYRKEFAFSGLEEKQAAYLTFKGVDYAAEVWLNGAYVGSHRGYFQTFRFDVSDHLKPGANMIHVVVHSPSEEVGAVWSLRKQLIKGIFNHHDTRPGGAWSSRGQEGNTGGIWAPVFIRVVDGAAIDALKVSPVVDDNDKGTLTLRFGLRGAPARIKRMEVRVTPKNFDGESIVFQKRISARNDQPISYEFDHGQVERWWPYELGAPSLYEVEVTVFTAAGVADSVRRTFGYRTIKRDVKSGEWHINGKRYFLRGTNYIATQWLSEMSPEHYDADLGLMRNAHINIVRVHAHIGAREFYEAADRMGMLVWQDFPLQWGYDDSRNFLEEAKRQTFDMVKHLDDHPSIIAWSMHNEPPWDADWMKYKYPDYDPEQNKGLTAELYETVKAADETRYSHSHSATAEHPWLGWYSGSWRDYAKPTDQNLITEFGAQALPNLNSLRRIFPEAAIWPDSEEDWELWNYHNFQKHELTNVAGVEIGEDIDEFISNTQSYQAKLTKFAAEAYRRQKYNPVGGIFQFMFNEDWPSVNWGIVDYWRNPKPGFHALKVAYQPILASIAMEKDVYESGEKVAAEIWLINDLYKTYENARYEVTISSPEGVIPMATYFVDVQPDSAKPIATWSKSFSVAGDYALVARLTASNGELLSVNETSFSVN